VSWQSRRGLGYVLVLALVLSACRITPDEIQKIEAENQLLRHEIRTIKENCGYYKVLELDVEETESSPP
jgi:starvation-inducible outer membrane lipoprotein